MWIKYLILFMIVFTHSAKTQGVDELKKINDTWHKFENAFKNLDAELFASIHRKDLVRVAGGRTMSGYEEYIHNYRQRFKENKANNVSLKIELRFLERVFNESTSSERGIYKMTRTNKDGSSSEFYGKFHVVMRKTDEEWMILMDYDSSEGNTIGADDFEKAYALEDVEAFAKK